MKYCVTGVMTDILIFSTFFHDHVVKKKKKKKDDKSEPHLYCETDSGRSLFVCNIL